MACDKFLIIANREWDMANLEVEVKFFLSDLEKARNNIKKTGGIFEMTETENNIRFENESFSLIKNGALLRLRSANTRYTLTYKGKTTNSASDFKIYDEIEVMVSDFDNMIKILNHIGYIQVQRYEKIRETYTIGNVLLCLDTMPYGNFLEIEGDPERIPSIAEKLGFQWENRILDNYLGMFEWLKKEYNLNFNDVTFDNFKQTHIDMGECIHLFFASNEAARRRE